MKNPAWTDEEFQFWTDHMQDYGDLWWWVPDCACGHPSADAKYDGVSGDFVATCKEGHVTVIPVLHSAARNISEEAAL